MAKKKGKAKEPDFMWPDMPRKRFKEIGKWTRTTADHLWLRDWLIIMVHAPLEPGHNFGAMCECVPGQKKANITLRWDFATWKLEDQRQTLVHELLHIHFDPIQASTRQGSAAWRLLGDTAGDLHATEIHWKIEHAVDDLACSISKFLPLP